MLFLIIGVYVFKSYLLQFDTRTALLVLVVEGNGEKRARVHNIGSPVPVCCCMLLTIECWHCFVYGVGCMMILNITCVFSASCNVLLVRDNDIANVNFRGVICGIQM